MTTFQTTDLRIVAQCERDMRTRRQTTVEIPMGRGNFTLTGVIESVVKSRHGSRYLSEISIQTQSHLDDVAASNLNFTPDPSLLPTTSSGKTVFGSPACADGRGVLQACAHIGDRI